MSAFKELYESDMARYGEAGANAYVRRFMRYFRRVQTCKNPLLRLYYRFMFKRVSEKRGNEIPWSTTIGKGLYLGHAYNIAINPSAVIGENCNLHKGVVIGQTNRGPRKGAPVIGNNVWIGMHATLFGKITVGEDVLIAANSFVNCDVPPHSIVLGNPCIIKHKDKATEFYINNTV